MADIPVFISTEIKKTSTLINPKVNAADIYNLETNTLTEANNVLAEGVTTGEVLKKHYGGQ